MPAGRVDEHQTGAAGRWKAPTRLLPVDPGDRVRTDADRPAAWCGEVTR